MRKCTSCDEELSFWARVDHKGRCGTCIDRRYWAEEAQKVETLTGPEKEAHEKALRLEQMAWEMMVTTETVLMDRKITARFGVVSAECAFGMNIFRDLFASVRDVFGGRSKAVQDTLRENREFALLELRKEAARLGANAVIGVDLDYSEISGGGKTMLFLVASGTAVKLE